MIIKENLASYRLGSVVSITLSPVGCCHTEETAHTVFTYIELIAKDGSRQYVYDNEEGYAAFEKSFMKNRFTRFHEFFTTEELAIEDRGFAKLKYYVRHGADSYLQLPLADALAELEADAAITKLADRITQINHYDAQVNYHMSADDELVLRRY